MSRQKTGGSSNKDTITLSDLFHLKKCERPRDEFWESFERRLKSRQLQALVRPTWKDRLVAIGTVSGSWAAPAAVASLAMILVWNVSREPYALTHQVEPRGERLTETRDEQLSEAVVGLEKEVAPAVAERIETPADVLLTQTGAKPREEPRPSFVFDAIFPNTVRQSSEPFRTEATPDTLRVGEPSAEYALNTYEYGPPSRFEAAPAPRRFRVHSDLYGAGPSRQLEGGVTMEF